ncbi:MAG: thiamine pyrophosphate-dependent enzyme, partial [Candidatus Sumerlaeota bacterium]
ALRYARRPILYLGGGVSTSGASRAAGALARRAGIPVVTSLMGLGAFPAEDPLFLGMIGMHGSRRANLALEQCDLLIAVGARFNDRTTGRINAFCPKATVAHIDIDARELGKICAPQIAVAADARAALEALLPRAASNERKDWLREIDALGPKPLVRHSDPSHPLSRIRQIGELMGDDATIVTDVGQHQMWTAMAYPHRRAGHWVTSGGLGTMGFGLPAAIGTALARPDSPTVCVTGDGSLMMNIQELATLAETGANVKIFLMNNGHLGLVRQQQELFFEERTFAVKFQNAVDFCAIARGFGLPVFRLGADGDADELAEVLKNQGPALIECPVAWRENVYPMVPPGGANRQMLEDCVVS